MAQKKKKAAVSPAEVLWHYWKEMRGKRAQFLFSYGLFFLAQVVVVVIPIYFKKFFDIIEQSKNPHQAVPQLIGIILIILLLRAANWLLWRVAMYIYNAVQTHVMANIRQRAFEYVLGHSHTFFANNFTGGIVQKVNRYVRTLESIMDSFTFNFTPIIIVVFGAIGVTWAMSPVLSIVLIVWAVAFTLFAVIFLRWKLQYDNLVSEGDSQTAAYLSDSITNNNAVSFFTGEKYESTAFAKILNDLREKTFYSWELGDVMDAVQTFLIMLVEFFVLFYGVKYWEIGLITVGTFVLAQTYILSISTQFWRLAGLIKTVYQGVADAAEMIEVLKIPHEIQDLPDAKTLAVSQGRISFKNVLFGFKNGIQIINNLTTDIQPGQKVAIVGHSGAGKTTLVRLIMRVYDVASGAIEIDGQNIKNVTQESLRECISFVPQDPVLFHRTLMENIRYGRRDATDAEVIEAAKLAHCDEFIDQLPLKYETFVGERGIKLSGGERQRVAIARAILKKAPILIFDEATSSLDSYSESLIQDALETLMKGATTIVIAHRLSTIKKMDRIISMEGGNIIEDGSHEDLTTKDSGLYKKLWDLQVKGFI